MGKKVTLNKIRHLTNIMKNMDEMRNAGDCCDFIIKAGIVKYPVHKNILSAASEYFKAMFRHIMKENRFREVEMNDVDSECLKSCIDFIYTGELHIPEGKNRELLHASKILQINDIKDAIIVELEDSLDVKNFFSTRQTAKLYNLESVFAKWKEFEKENIMEISSQPEFQNEEKANLLDILSFDGLLLSEKQKLDVTINWIGGNLEKKNDYLDFLNLIDLLNVPPDYLKSLIDNDPLISIDFKLYKTFNDAHRSVLERSLAELTKKKTYDEEATELESGDGKKLMFFDVDASCLHIVNPETNETKILNETNFSALAGLYSSFTAISSNSFIYILRENKSVHRLNFKDPKPNWDKMLDTLKVHGMLPPAASALGSVFVIGGSTNWLHVRPSNVVERFDPIVQRWSRLKNVPSSVSNHAVVSLDETIYCLGGRINGLSSNVFRAFNVLSSQWTDLPPMMNAKESCSAVAMNRRIFAFGGVGDPDRLNEVDCFDMITSQWSAITPKKETIKFPCACLIGDWAFIGSRGTSTNKIVKYNLKNNQWQRQSGFPSFRWKYFIGI